MIQISSSNRSPSTAVLLGNATLFNLSWLGIVLTQSALIAPAIVALHLALHFRWLRGGRRELALIIAVTLLGITLDQLLFAAGVFTLDGRAAMAPLWLSCLWPVFATTLMHAFAGLQRRLLVAALVGAVGGALAYSAGVQLSPVEFASPLWGPVFLGALWAVLFPLLLQIAARLGARVDALQSWEPAPQRACD